ncbi:PREDICTED: uncharacterized protein LOC109172016 [Ipomoea nil]|uniref:uncharacterized protein LOC109172016 n=1 Tax=Ipomoea nil TaxID=35883 RepID=UPI000900B9B7|nr:PREDICTED: uncharacterized protein LOC109172016 [Ipomoea nil]XP_019176685.1 PREDICTED: uncharacterized protein LOC109172016 [Ipomoea nil]XP_019176686.1 PREDICTED: uncharacterized protein LOC109172016 [Ipomoea nil]
MPPSYFPLRWESTGDQWWFASPIDWAAANGHYDLVRELLHLDTNLIIKLTSLRRIRRLETVWDDEEQFDDVAKCRCGVARKLLLECETKEGQNSLIRAGYGGWLLYTAASAGDMEFVKELLERDPLLVFGEGEFGVTDILYAAARSRSSEVFRLLLDSAVSLKQLGNSGEESEEDVFPSSFKAEMTSRAVHAAARGGNVEILMELLGNCLDALMFRDGLGSTLLHSAAGRGQVEVIKSLLARYDGIIDSRDNQGNTTLHVAAYRGYLHVMKVLVSASPSSTLLTNNYGDTFLHMAVAGFRTPSFHRLDRQIELMKQLVRGKIVCIEDVVNLRNHDGKTALHMAVTENIRTDLVELLMTAFSIDLNVRDADGNTPLDLLKQGPGCASSEILIKRLISAGGISNCCDHKRRGVLASHLRIRGIAGSPGTSFRIPDGEIFLYTGLEKGYEASTGYASCSGEISPCHSADGSNLSQKKKAVSGNSAARRLKFLLQWPKKKDSTVDTNSVESLAPYSSSSGEKPVPLRHKFSRGSSLPNSKRVLSVCQSLPSPSTKKKFAAGLRQGVIQITPQSSLGSPPTAPSSFSGSPWASPNSAVQDKSSNLANASSTGASSSSDLRGKQKSRLGQKRDSFNMKVMNQFFCFGTEGLAVDNPVRFKPQDQCYKHAVAT